MAADVNLLVKRGTIVLETAVMAVMHVDHYFKFCQHNSVNTSQLGEIQSEPHGHASQSLDVCPSRLHMR